jgi:YegS/Rv2252/BmrU family lipid kinase
MRVALVTNAASGSGTDADRLAALLRDAGAEVSVHAFDPGDGDGAVDRAAAAAAAAAPDRLAVAGGDGSIGPVAVHAARAGLPLAVIPTGTANDFARAIGIPLDLRAASALAATETRERPVDILRAGDRPFLNAASVGLSVIAAHRARPLKRLLGPFAYALGAIQAGLTATPLRCHVRADGAQVYSGPVWQVIVAGTGAFGGGSELDDADPSDRLVDVAVLEAGPRVKLIRRAWGMRGGDLTAQPGVHHARGRVIDLQLAAGTAFNVDGEVCDVAPTRFCARGERVRVVSPD